MNSATAPIALFVYRRPDHTRRCLESLRANPLARRSDLFVFSDGPANPAAAEGVAGVRSLLKGLEGFRSVTVVERESNFGLSRSIISGVTDIIRRFGRIIVVEDDLLASPHFLGYMNDGLEVYRDTPEVASIHGYFFPVRSPLPETFFLRGADCWGWATWERSWKSFEPDGEKLLRRLRERGLTHAFDRNGAYPYTRMLEDQIAGMNDSWAVRWHASAFLEGKYTLFPGRSLIRNIGMDDLATHSVRTDAFEVSPSERPVAVSRIPVQEEPRALEAVRRFFGSMRPSLAQRAARRIRGLISRPKSR